MWGKSVISLLHVPPALTQIESPRLLLVPPCKLSALTTAQFSSSSGSLRLQKRPTAQQAPPARPGNLQEAFHVICSLRYKSKFGGNAGEAGATRTRGRFNISLRFHHLPETPKVARLLGLVPLETGVDTQFPAWQPDAAAWFFSDSRKA